jgi:TetR/AcrR family fatty acid metabolism transcriptional regulator
LYSEKKSKYLKILDSAVKVFAESGVENSTVSKIASRAGVADGTIYLYFKNKDDILTQFANDRGVKILEKFESEVEKGHNAREKLYNLFVSHLKEFSENVELAAVFQAEISRFHSVQPQIMALSSRYRAIIEKILIIGVKENFVRSDVDVGFIKNAAAGAVNEVINSELVRKGSLSIEDRALKLVDFVFKGVGDPACF